MNRPEKPASGTACPHYQHAFKLRQHGDLESARDTVLQAVDADVNNADAWALLSDIYDDMEEPWHAQEAARQAVRANPNRTDLRMLLGVRLMIGNELAEALATFDAVLGSKPKSAAAHFNRGVVLARLNRAEEAVDALILAVDIEPTLAEALGDSSDLDPIRNNPRFPASPSSEPDLND